MTQVKTGLIADGSITTAKFDPSAVCPTATLATTATTANGVAALAVGTAGLAASAVTPAKIAQPFTIGTAVASTAGTAIDFTGIPSWVKKITVLLQGVSTNSSGGLLVQLGTSGGIEATSYASQVNAFNNTPGGVAVTNGIQVTGGSAASYAWNGIVQIANVSGNLWVASGTALTTAAASTAVFAGSKTLSAVLDRIRLTSTTTDTFDAGSINILYE